MISYQCPHCGAALSAPEQFAGQTGSCRQCGQSITIPAASAAPSAPAPLPATAPVNASGVNTWRPAVAAPPAPMPRASAVAALVVVFLLLGLFTVLFVTWVAPRGKDSDQVFTMAIPLLALVLVVLSLLAIVAMRHRLRAAAAEWLGRPAPEKGPPWQSWGMRGNLACPFCSAPVDITREAANLVQILAQVNPGEMPTRMQRCARCGNAWESRIGTRHQGTRAEREARPHYEWRPLAPGVPPPPAPVSPPASASAPSPPESREDLLRREARQAAEYYARQLMEKQPALDASALQRMARQYAMRAMMQRHQLDAGAASRLFSSLE